MFLDPSDFIGYGFPSQPDGKETLVAFNKVNPLTFEQLSAAIAYDPDRGTFTWKVSPCRRMKAGDPAGAFKRTRSTKERQGIQYLYLTLDGYSTPAARVAWLFQTGTWPEGNVLYKDGDTLNLKFDNLQEALFTKTVVSATGLRQRKEPSEVQYGRSLKRYYGIDVAEYGEMMVAQNGLCAICHKPEERKANGKVRPMSVDHCHTSGKVRGLLCSYCNSVLGQAKDSEQVLLSAVEYLRKYSLQQETA